MNDRHVAMLEPAMTLDARRILDRCEALARCTEQPDGLTRLFLTPQQQAAGGLVMGWMREAGMTTRVDAVGNVVGRWEGARPGLPCLMLGSHLDTVRDAGRYDGVLGVVTAIECVAALHARGTRLPFAIEVIGFADAEGVRFSAPLLGSRAVAGTFDPGVLDRIDVSGVTMREALLQAGHDPARIDTAARAPDDVLAYVELHVEQGPVLEAEGLPVGVVTAISGGDRFEVEITGVAGHAGTVPMALRRDALMAAADCALAVERIARSMSEVVGTVGRLETAPGAINVIPGRARFALDVRAPTDEVREQVVEAIRGEFVAIADRRDVELAMMLAWEARTTECAPSLQRQLVEAIHAEGIRVHHLPSGAGHDGMAIAEIAPIGMLFVRSKGGISHSPAESVTLADVDAGARVLLRFVEHFQRPQR
jgi:allantoate deiminase